MAPVTRVYNPERGVVVVQEKGESRELSYVTLPVLFEKETAELLDARSRANLKQVAGVINDISSTETGARFDIEGHTSTDGTDEFNMNLSVARAQRVYDELTQRYGVAPGVLTAHGYGENHPMYPKGTEAQMQQDRRVLVVRSQQTTPAVETGRGRDACATSRGRASVNWRVVWRHTRAPSYCGALRAR
jgi:outer membrane protein OmpA-like peptidoglycan-associated protein